LARWPAAKLTIPNVNARRWLFQQPLQRVVINLITAMYTISICRAPAALRVDD